MTMPVSTDKLLVVDYSELFYVALFTARNVAHQDQTGYKLPFEFFLLRKLATLTKAFPGRKLILTGDGKQSWRKQLYPDYKCGRKKFRESYEDIDWTDLYQRYDELLGRIDVMTPIDTYRDEYLEADDIIAVLAKSGADVIAVTSDKDMNQLYIYPNFKQVSPRSPKLQLKDIKNPKAELQKLIDKGDEADNIPAAKTESQKLINKKLVDLTDLPEVVIKRVTSVLNQRTEKKLDYDQFMDLYRFKFLMEFFKTL